MDAVHYMDNLEDIERCLECSCCFDSYWEYKNFSNKKCIICPDCKTEYWVD